MLTFSRRSTCAFRISALTLFTRSLTAGLCVGARMVKPAVCKIDRSLMLAALLYCALPLVSKQREHIVIDTFDTFMSPVVKRGFDVFADIVCSVTLCGIGYLIFRRAVRVAEYGDTTRNGTRTP